MTAFKPYDPLIVQVSIFALIVTILLGYYYVTLFAL